MEDDILLNCGVPVAVSTADDPYDGLGRATWAASVSLSSSLQAGRASPRPLRNSSILYTRDFQPPFRWNFSSLNYRCT